MTVAEVQLKLLAAVYFQHFIVLLLHYVERVITGKFTRLDTDIELLH